jgi:hypothetical protein
MKHEYQDELHVEIVQKSKKLIEKISRSVEEEDTNSD